MTEYDIIVGKPIFYNYYTIFSVQNGKVGFAATSHPQNTGEIMTLLLFIFIPLMGIIACFLKYKNREEPVYCVRPLRLKKSKPNILFKDF